MGADIRINLEDFTVIGPFTWRWPENYERFERGWTCTVLIAGRRWSIRQGLGSRHVYSTQRVHGVTWVDGVPRVEGVAADDYDSSKALISILKTRDNTHVQSRAEVPTGYAEFEVVRHYDEIMAPRSPRGFAVKIEEDDLPRWALHGVLRAQLKEQGRSPQSTGLPHEHRLARNEPTQRNLLDRRFGGPVIADLSAGDLATMRLRLRDLLDRLEGGAGGEDGPRRILRLRAEGKIPAEISGFMLTVIDARNVAMHERRELPEETKLALVAAWKAVGAWATRVGIGPLEF